MLHHLVLFRFLPACSAADIAEIDRRFRLLASSIPAIQSLTGGEDCSPEGLQHGFTHGWLLSFADAAARDHYLQHPVHQEFIAFSKAFIADVLVCDFPAS